MLVRAKGAVVQCGLALVALALARCEGGEPAPTCKLDADAGLPLECCSPCFWGVTDCDAAPHEENELEMLQALGGCNFSRVARGRCKNGLRFVSWTDLATEIRYFDARGNFVAQRSYNDLADPVCLGQTYFPELIECEEPVVQQVCPPSGT